MSKKIKLNDEDYPTTGHVWDGIREYDKPMPRWWLYTFYLCIVFSIGYHDRLSSNTFVEWWRHLVC